MHSIFPSHPPSSLQLSSSALSVLICSSCIPDLPLYFLNYTHCVIGTTLVSPFDDLPLHLLSPSPSLEAQSPAVTTSPDIILSSLLARCRITYFGLRFPTCFSRCSNPISNLCLAPGFVKCFFSIGLHPLHPG
ncbi:hypothetical protein BJX70DRAFT_288521 [Aspergillus crustosus]